MLDVEALVVGTKPCDRKLIGLRLSRRLGSILGHRRWVHIQIPAVQRRHRDELDAETIDAYVKEGNSSDQQLHGAYVGYKEARDALNSVRRGRAARLVVAIPSTDSRTATLGVHADGWSEHGGNAKGKDTNGKGKRTRPLEKRLESRTQCRLFAEDSRWQSLTFRKLVTTCLP